MTETLAQLSEREWLESLQAAVVRRFVDCALNRGNFAVAESHLAPGYLDHGGFLGQCAEPLGFAALLAGLRRAFPDGEYRIEDLISDADKVVVRMTFTGSHLGPFRGHAATGRRVRVTGIHIFRCRGAAIVEHWAMENHQDLDALFRQEGPTGAIW